MPVLIRASGIVGGAGGGGTTNSTTTATTPAIRINSGDVVVAVSYVSTTAVQFSPSSPSNPNAKWQQRFLMSLTPFFVYLWTLENPVPANEPITFTRPTAAAGIAAAQVYGGVGRIGTIVQGAAIGTTSPSYSPSITTTVPGSVVVGGYVFNRGTTQAFAPTGQRTAFIAAGGTVLIADLTIATPLTVQIPIPSTSSQPSGFQYVSLSLVLEPAAVTPPPPPGSISAIVDEIKQWRLQAQLNKIYLMPPAQRTAALAQLKALADELKQAQIAQRG